MPYVTPASLTVKTCFQTRYSLPYYQREYKWESKHFLEMLNDIQEAFQADFEASHGRKEVANYTPYFLGSVITSIESGGVKPLVDGQQRLTSLFLLLAFLKRFCQEHAITDAADLANLLGSVSYGNIDYSITFSSSRRRVVDTYLADHPSHSAAMDAVDALTGLDDGDQKVIQALRSAENELNKEVKENIAFFIDYVIEKVVLIEIAVASETEAHRVFVTMNDRGLRLGPVELLKGRILSHISDPQQNEECHRKWIDSVTRLKSFDPEEDSLFFRSLFRAKWAVSLRGKKKGDAPADFEIIGDAYHRWFETNNSKIGLNKADDYLAFARDRIPHYESIYSFIRSAEDKSTGGFEAIYYNATRKYSFQPMVLLAAVRPTDSEDIWKAKLSLVARYLDLVLTCRMIEGKGNTYDNLRDFSFAVTLTLRDKSIDELHELIAAEWGKHEPAFELLRKMAYPSQRTEILFVLARIGDYLEKALQLSNTVGFPTYWQRDKSNAAFDIEHILTDKATYSDVSAMGFLNGPEYGESRDLLGSLILLPRSRNRSIQDKKYADKLFVYATENVLAQTLFPAFYINHPNARLFAEAHPTLGLQPITAFTKESISSRANLYVGLAKMIWRP